MVAVFMIGAVVEVTGASGTCMFILMPYFAALAATYPVLVLNRFGAGVGVYVPYVVIGFVPLYYYDWLQSGALVGVWAVFVWSATGLVIGTSLDLVNRIMIQSGERTRAIVIGATMQAVTFVVMLVGLTYLYKPTSSMGGHLLFFNQKWLFTLPWMVLNGCFGGYTAYALRKRI
ncbi:MAG: hypothetical protein V1799_06320 [bacterium]